MALFAGMLLAKDRTSSFLMRLFTSPMTAADFILGYTLPMLVMTIVQAAITLLAAGAFGLDIHINILFAISMTAVTSLFFVGTGLLFGSLLNEKAVGGVCGALLTNIAIGGAFKTITHMLPFYHSTEAIRESLSGNFAQILPHLIVVIGYTIVIFTLAIITFNRKMNGEKA